MWLSAASRLKDEIQELEKKVKEEEKKKSLLPKPKPNVTNDKEDKLKDLLDDKEDDETIDEPLMPPDEDKETLGQALGYGS